MDDYESNSDSSGDDEAPQNLPPEEEHLCNNDVEARGDMFWHVAIASERLNECTDYLAVSSVVDECYLYKLPGDLEMLPWFAEGVIRTLAIGSTEITNWNNFKELCVQLCPADAVHFDLEEWYYNEHEEDRLFSKTCIINEDGSIDNKIFNKSFQV